MVGIILSGCRGQLALNAADPRTGLPTATRGVASTGLAQATTTPVVAPPVASAVVTAVAEAPLPTITAAPVAPSIAEATVAPVVPTAPPPTSAGPPTVNPVLSNVQLPTPADLEARWRQLQVERTPFDQPQRFYSEGWEIVWWFDPIVGQFVPLGEIRGEFTAQASFRIKGQWIEALEIALQVNQQYDLQIPEPILARMRNAGRGEWAEVFIYRDSDVQRR